MRSVAIGVVLLIALSGCGPAFDGADPPAPSETPSSSRTPTSASTLPAPTGKPDISELVIGPDGLGPLLLGSPPPNFGPDVDVLVYVNDYCQEAFDDGYVGDPGLWVANYPEALDGEETRPFGVWVTDGAIKEIAVYLPGVHTERGIGVGSTREEVLAAYPDGFSRTVPGGDSPSFYVIDSATGQLQIEVVEDEPYFGSVFSLISTPLSAEVYGGYATDTALGRCVNG